MTVKRGKVVSEGEFRRMWNDHSIPAQKIADYLGITIMAVRCRARIRGLPARPGGGGANRKIDPALFRRMWDANVKPTEIAAHFGCHPDCVVRRAREWGFPPRDCTRWNSLTLEDFQYVMMRDAMAETAKAEQAARRKMEQEGTYRRPGQDKRAA